MCTITLPFSATISKRDTCRANVRGHTSAYLVDVCPPCGRVSDIARMYIALASTDMCLSFTEGGGGELQPCKPHTVYSLYSSLMAQSHLVALRKKVHCKRPQTAHFSENVDTPTFHRCSFLRLAHLRMQIEHCELFFVIFA